jgi:hypothetical protein
MSSKVLLQFFAAWVLSLSSGAAYALPPASLSTLTQGHSQELQDAQTILANINPGERVRVMMEIFRAAESLLLIKGWSQCEMPPEAQRGPIGFRFLYKELLCFQSPVKYAGIWMVEFVRAPIEQQAYLFMTIERLRSSLERSKPLSDQSHQGVSQKFSPDLKSRRDQTGL